MNLSRHDVWGHFAPMFHLVDVFAVYALTLVGGRHVTLPAFAPADALLAIGARSRVSGWGAGDVGGATALHQPPRCPEVVPEAPLRGILPLPRRP